MSKDINFTRLPPINNKIFTIDEKDEERQNTDKKCMILKKKEKKDVPKEEDKFLYKGFKFRFFIEYQNGFYGLFRSILKLNKAEWQENLENDPLFCN